MSKCDKIGKCTCIVGLAIERGSKKICMKGMHTHVYICIVIQYLKRKGVPSGLLYHAKIIDPTMYTKCIVGNIEIIRPGDWKWLYSHDQRPI